MCWVWKKVLGNLFWSCIFKNMLICNNIWNFLQRFKICIYQNCPRRFVELHNLAQKSKKGQAKMEQGMCQFKSSPKEIEYANEDKANFLFLLKFIFAFCFWIPTKHSLTFFFAFVDLIIKLSFSKKLCNLKNNNIIL